MLDGIGFTMTEITVAVEVDFTDRLYVECSVGSAPLGIDLNTTVPRAGLSIGLRPRVS
jgi:hypothetical protein